MSEPRGVSPPEAPTEEVRPTAAPFALACGIVLLFGGVVLHWLYSLAGLLVLLGALWRWIAEIGRESDPHPRGAATDSQGARP